MTSYRTDFSYSVPEWSSVTLEAESLKEAEDKALEVIQDLYPEAIDIEVEKIFEDKDAS